MDPPIENSVVRAGENRWLLGSLYTCELVLDVPDDAVVSWEADGNTYCIRKSSSNAQDRTVLRDAECDLVHHAGTSAAVWHIGGVFVKVKAWRDDMQLESNTIQFVNSNSPVPTPEIVFSWVDRSWNRSILVMKAMKGQTLAQAWGSLSTVQRAQIADTVAQFCGTLASFTSNMLMTANGKGLLEPFLTSPPLDSEPSWKPQILGPFSHDELRTYLSGSPGLEGHIDLFKFYHADLGPSNIIVTEDGSIVGIIDWESAAFYPKFWLGTKPLVSAGFFLPVAGAEKQAWAFLLAKTLKREGLSPDMETYQAWKKAIKK